MPSRVVTMRLEEGLYDAAVKMAHKKGVTLGTYLRRLVEDAAKSAGWKQKPAQHATWDKMIEQHGGER